jgi:hypothetical protein
LEIDATASQDGGDEVPRSLRINVSEPEHVAPPEIVSAEPSSHTIKLGESFRLDYKLGPSVTKATLMPDNMVLSTDLTEALVKPVTAGVNQYMIDAQNSAGQSVSAQFSVNVIEPSDASILLFDITPRLASPDVQTVTVSWRVSTNAQLVTLQIGAGQPMIEDINGKQDFPVTATTSFKLVAADANNRDVSKKIIVPYVVPKINSTQPITPPAGDQTNPTNPTTAGAPPPNPPVSTTGTTTAGGR